MLHNLLFSTSKKYRNYSQTKEINNLSADVMKQIYHMIGGPRPDNISGCALVLQYLEAFPEVQWQASSTRMQLSMQKLLGDTVSNETKIAWLDRIKYCFNDVISEINCGDKVYRNSKFEYTLQYMQKPSQTLRNFGISDAFARKVRLVNLLGC